MQLTESGRLLEKELRDAGHADVLDQARRANVVAGAWGDSPHMIGALDETSHRTGLSAPAVSKTYFSNAETARIVLDVIATTSGEMPTFKILHAFEDALARESRAGRCDFSPRDLPPAGQAQVVFRLPRAGMARLRQEAAQRGCAVADVVGDLVNAYLGKGVERG